MIFATPPPLVRRSPPPGFWPAPLIALAMLASAHGDVLLMVDDLQLVARNGLQRVVLPAHKLPEPVIRGNQRWSRNPYAYGTFLYDRNAQTYKAWYQSVNRGTPVATPLLYNLSVDGRTWNPPSLGLVDFEGSAANNIALAIGHLYSPSVVKLPDERRDPLPYRLAFWDIRQGDTYDGGGGMYTATSTDGVQWNPDSERPRLVATKETGSISDVLDVMFDVASGKFVVHAKCWRWNGSRAAYRMICRAESPDFKQWSPPQVVLDTRADDPSQPQTYGMPVFQYEGHYFGLLRIYHSPGDETIEIELAHSRDDIHWQRVAPGQPLLPVGPADAWDDGMVFTANPILRDEEMEIFYGGWDGPHNVGQRRAQIGLATLPRGRLAGLTPEAQRGALETESFPWRGERLALNVDATQGSVRAALLTETGDPIDGRTFEDCPPFTGDSLRHVPRWNGKIDGESLPPRVRVGVELTGGACLYEIVTP